MSNQQQIREISKFQTELIRPVEMVQTGENHYFFDFGKAAFGTVLITLKAKQPDYLVIHLGEAVE